MLQFILDADSLLFCVLDRERTFLGNRSNFCEPKSRALGASMAIKASCHDRYRTDVQE
jgi:hypothetical protein